MILTVVVKVVTEGSVGVGTVAETIGLAAGFLLVTGLLAVFVVPRALDLVHRWARGGGALLVATVVLMLGFAGLADAAKLAFIIGAFMAGLGVGRSRHAHHIEDGVLSISRIFVPVFFVGIGVNADLEAMARPSVLGLAAVLTTVGIIGKVVAGLGASGTGSNRLLVGIGMIPRGEVGLIFASIGLSRGVLDDDLYGALLIMVLVTTVIAPPLLRWRIQQVGVTEQPATTTAAALAAVVSGDRAARADLGRAADLAVTAPALAALVTDLRSDEVGSGREVPFPRLDALMDAGEDDLALRSAAAVLDIGTAVGDDAIASIAPLVSDDVAVGRVAAVAAALLDVSVSPDGISDDEIARVRALVGDGSDVITALRLALLTPDLDPFGARRSRRSATRCAVPDRRPPRKRTRHTHETVPRQPRNTLLLRCAPITATAPWSCPTKSHTRRSTCARKRFVSSPRPARQQWSPSGIRRWPSPRRRTPSPRCSAPWTTSGSSSPPSSSSSCRRASHSSKRVSPARRTWPTSS